MKRTGAAQFRDEDPQPACCPACGRTIDACTSANKSETERGPKEGDLGLCVYCDTVLYYQDERILRAAEPEEIPAGLLELRERWMAAKKASIVILSGRIS